jgi:vacuolar-type H+-ATPase subunit D/Vma8
VTRRSAELLDRKRQLLRQELAALELRREQTEAQWAAACAAADTWAQRAAVLGAGDLAAVASEVAGGGRVVVTWDDALAVSRPAAAMAELPIPGAGALAAANAAVAPAAAAHRVALEAAARHGAVVAAIRRVDDELRSTQRRLRAIERRRLPALETAMHDLEIRLDELEREERVVARWARVRS